MTNEQSKRSLGQMANFPKLLFHTGYLEYVEVIKELDLGYEVKKRSGNTFRDFKYNFNDYHVFNPMPCSKCGRGFKAQDLNYDVLCSDCLKDAIEDDGIVYPAERAEGDTETNEYTLCIRCQMSFLPKDLTGAYLCSECNEKVNREGFDEEHALCERCDYVVDIAKYKK